MKVLLSCRQMLACAKQIASTMDTVQLGEIDWSNFDDAWPNIFIKHVDSLIHGQDVFFLASLDHPADVFEQLAVIYALPRYEARSVTLILPYFPTGTMERVDQEGQIATAHTLARMLSIIPLSASGPAKIVIYDLHALQGRFYFGDQVIPRLETTLTLLEDKLAELGEEISICFPDEGAYKRFGRQLSKYAQIICAKNRTGAERRVKILSGGPRGKHIVIVDDLAHGGKTILECRHTLIGEGAQKISAFVPHAVFEKRAWEQFTNNDQLFANFWISDSCPKTIQEIGNKKPFEVLSLAPLIRKLILASQ